MYFKQLKCGGDRNFGYIIADEESKKCALIDPSPDATEAIKEAKDRDFEITYVINTHSHFDHTVGNSEIKSISKAKIVCHSTSPEGEIKVNEGDRLPLGNQSIKIVYTPGHTKDSICLLVEGRLMTGDTLFVGMIGGTQTKEDAMEQFDSLKRLMKLEDNISVWPGHNYGIEMSSTIKKERENNPFCQRLYDFEAFYNLKENWDEYKREHNIP